MLNSYQALLMCGNTVGGTTAYYGAVFNNHLVVALGIYIVSASTTLLLDSFNSAKIEAFHNEQASTRTAIRESTERIALDLASLKS